MDFYNAMRNTYLDSDANVSITENGAVGYRSTGKELLDLNFAVASLHGVSEYEIGERFAKAYYEDKLLAIKWLFFARDIRGGLGERRLFRTCLYWLADNDPQMLKKVLTLVPEYGRWDDLWGLLDYNEFCDDVITIAGRQLFDDMENYVNNKPISLLAKWLPSINTSSAKTKAYAKTICEGIKWSQRDYRKVLSKLRSYLDVTEKKMSNKDWGSIVYETVPSRANLIYNKAFLRNDEERRKAYLDALDRGETKINSSVLYPHEIVHKYTENAGWYRVLSLPPCNSTLEALWKNLPDLIQGDATTMVVADGSGSMLCNINGSSATALDVANALAIYFAERARGPYQNCYITFSERPQFVDFGKAVTLRDKIMEARVHTEVANTNIEAVFDLILDTAVRNRLRQDDIPANVLIISDMEFDGCAQDNIPVHQGAWNKGVRSTLFSEIQERYASAGYKLPRLVFWNVNSRTNTIPVRENEMGVALVSGFSVNICKMVMSGKTDPFECLLETLNSERYKPVEEAVKRV